MTELAYRRTVVLSWRRRDSMPWLTWTGVVFVAVGLGLRAFGLPSLDLHGPTHYVGIMDPLCGMTRAARALGLGQFAVAWRYNPGIFVLATATAGALVRALVGVATGRWFTIVLPERRIFALFLIAAVAALWINQQLHVSLLTT